LVYIRCEIKEFIILFREDNVLVDTYTFEILVHFVESLAIAHKDDKSLGRFSCRLFKEIIEHSAVYIMLKLLYR